MSGIALTRSGRDARPRPTGSSRSARFEQRMGTIYALPTAVLVAVFFVVPLALCVWISFNHWPLIGASEFNAGANYAVLGDPLLLKAARFTLVYTLVTTVVLSTVSFVLALLVQGGRRGTGFFRTVYFLPTAIGLSSVSLLFLAMFSSQIGPLGAITEFLGFGEIDWLGTPTSALTSTVAMVTWRFSGFYMLILLTGLQAIPGDVYEAARVDGSGWWQTMRYVTIPLLRPTLAMMLVLSVTGSLLAFEQFYILTGGGPDNSTITLVMALYRQAFIQFDLGRASAIGVVLLVVLVVINGLQLSLLREPRIVKR